MPEQSVERTALIATRDLFFRGKLEAVVRQAGWEPVRDGPAAVAVLELEAAASVERVRALAAAGVRVIAFGAHVAPDLLRAARAAGAVAVPNSRLEAAVRQTLAAHA